MHIAETPLYICFGGRSSCQAPTIAKPWRPHLLRLVSDIHGFV